MRKVIAVVLMSLAMASTAQALTFKKGEVLGCDGKTYKGASPEQLGRLIECAAASDIPAGVVSNNVFLVAGDKVVQDITGNQNITFDQVEALNHAVEANGEDISSLLSEGGIEGLDAELV